MTPTPLPRLDAFERARLHPIQCARPAPDFFEGALMGNGGLGVVVCTRPDAVVLYFGHNEVWDIRVAEKNREKIGTFADVFARVKSEMDRVEKASDSEWLSGYLKMTRENYAKPYPRPLPCGALVLGFDRRVAELLGHRLDVSEGICDVFFKASGKRQSLRVRVDMTADRVWLRATGNWFSRIRLLPDPKTPADLPKYTAATGTADDTISFRQTLPAKEPDEYDAKQGHVDDRAFRLSVLTSARIEQREQFKYDRYRPMEDLERAVVNRGALIACVQLDHGPASAIDSGVGKVPEPTPAAFDAAARAAGKAWRSFWQRSAVQLDDADLERTWYRNLYFFRCGTRPGVTCPGLYANWCFGDIGTSWHGDWHLDYNTQQPFWLVFAANQLDAFGPYADMVDHLRPVARQWAREYYGLRGAQYPVSAYPVNMTMNPYPLPTWGWQMCLGPWTVQALWWRYTYSMDRAFLEQRAFEPIKEVVQFNVDYMTRPGCRGPEWGDDKYHLFPTVPSELYGLSHRLKYNRDAVCDLTLIRFVFVAYLEACRVLGREAEEAALIAQVKDVLAHFPEYPTSDSPRGRVMVSVPGENPETVYNVPANLMPVFPGEEFGLDSPPETLKLARNSLAQHRNEGGNELVFLNLIAARLGRLDLDAFKREIEYNLHPNGSCTDRILQVHGRYSDATSNDYMSRMGVWFENTALPAVISECLMQSYSRVIRLFPNWPADKDASFRDLRAVGAFLVSARQRRGKVVRVEVTSEAGQTLRLRNPWRGKVSCASGGRRSTLAGRLLEVQTRPGQRLVLTPAG